jgi:hypothetical protein
MKKLLCAVASILLLVGMVRAGVDDVNFGGTLKLAVPVTNSVVVRGEVAGVLVTLPTAMTGTVVITSAEGTIFSKTITGAAGSQYYSLLYPEYGSTGSALTKNESTSVTNAIMGRLVVAGKVTAVMTQTGDTATGCTNALVVRINVIK